MHSKEVSVSDCPPRSTITVACRAARARLAQAGPRLRRVLRQPSRSTIANAVALLALLLLTVGDVRGLVAFFSVVGLAVLLRSEHTQAGESSASPERQPPTELPS